MGSGLAARSSPGGAVVIRALKVYRERRTGVPYVVTTLRVNGQAQIDMFHALFAATARVLVIVLPRCNCREQRSSRAPA